MKHFFQVMFWLCAGAVFSQTHLDYLGQVQFPVRSSSLTRYEAEGKEYALIGTYDGTSIIDISDPTNPVELFYVNGPAGIWREMKTYNAHAYITNETEGGLQIIDLSNLPSSISDTFLTILNTGDTLETAHTIFVDENGLAYLFGSNLDNGGATILDLNADAMSPPKVGAYTLNYIHDGFVRGDTLWACEIYIGKFAAVDMTDKTNPVLLAEQSTPNSFTHNCWLSDNGDFLFTTDEKSGAFITAYDVSDLSDIKEVGRYQSHPGTGVIPHNTYFLNNYLINAYYRDGVIILDATKPDNLVQIGNFDTSPFEPSGSFNGCWGVDPYLSSGNIIASDIEEGLFILQPDYHRASYLEGNVFDELNEINCVNAKIEIMSTENFTNSNFLGDYKTGTSEAGVYDIRISKEGCYTKIYPNIALTSGETFILDAIVECTTLVDIHDIQQKLILEAYPNLFETETEINFALPQFDSGVITIYSDMGDKIESISLLNPSGKITLGNQLSSGIYFIQLLSKSGFSKSIRIIKS